MPRDQGGSPERAAEVAQRAIDEGAEIIIGPLFAQPTAAVAPVARRANVPVISFSTDRDVAGDGVYLLSFQPETEVDRIVSYAARSGRSSFAALVPQTAYGTRVNAAFRNAVMRSGGRLTGVQTFPARADAVAGPAAQALAGAPDAILIGEGGLMLRAVSSALPPGDQGQTAKLLGTGLWNDPALLREPMLIGGWFASPAPDGWNRFVARYRGIHNAAPPRIATLAYDAMSLVTLMSRTGQPYRRFTAAALTEPDGFSGIDGIFRFRSDGTADRGLAVLQVGTNGTTVVDPAPRSFVGAGG
jgi:ABC-type branched-subunit amino acid transport system substrate-binding protein